MYFTRKKTTVNTTLFHLDDMTLKERHEHLTEIYSIACSSLSSLTNSSSKLPIHFIIPVMYNENSSDEVIFSSSNRSILSDVLGSVNYDAVSYPKVVIDNLFSDKAQLLLQSNKTEKQLLKKSIFTREISKTTIPASHTLRNDIPLEDEPYSNIEKKVANTRHGFFKEFGISKDYQEKQSENTSDENKLIKKLSKKVTSKEHTNIKVNKLFVIDYTISLSEIGDLVISLLRIFRKNRGRYMERNSDNVAYGHRFLETMYEILMKNEGKMNFIKLLCERLGIKDEAVITNLNHYVIRRMPSIYDDHICMSSDFHLNKESVNADEVITNINNTFIPITFFFYLTTKDNIFNKPKEVVKYFHSLTGTSSLKGNLSYFDENVPQDNYHNDSYTITIATTVLPVNFTNFILKSKMYDLKNKQVFEEVPNKNLLSTQYNLLYNSDYKKDFVFYDDEKFQTITKELSSYINVRFDKNIKVLYFPYIPSQYPLSLYAYRSNTYRTYDIHMKEMFFEYLGISIDFDKPIKENIDKIKIIFNSLKTLNTVSDIFISKGIEDYVYTWLISLYLHNNLLFKYTFYDFSKKISNWYSDINIFQELEGGWRYDFMHHDYSRYREYTKMCYVYPSMIEIIHKMLYQSNIDDVLIILKRIISEIESESKALILGISDLYKTKETILSWENIESRSGGRLYDPTFNKIEHLLYNQYVITLSSKIGDSLCKNNYENLLKHLLTYIKAFHYFRNMKNTFYPLLEAGKPKSFIKDNWKTLCKRVDQEDSSMLFGLSQTIKQHLADYPKTKNVEVDCGELYKWYEEIHLTSSIETF